MRLPPRPTVYEINTAVWLRRLAGDRGRPLTLDEVPGAAWDALAGLPVDAVWLMGVWERSPAGLEIARTNAELDAGNRAALPDLRDADVIGSPYCVRDYAVDARFGGPGALATARAALADRGLALILDYVPNHVAPDHPWTATRPDVFVRGGEDDLRDHPAAFLRTAAGVLAKGRDPYFAPWPDVVQLNAFAPALRDAAAATLIAIGDQCDGLRCDMAMLMCNEVFARTWGERAGPPPADEYWSALIGRVRAAHPDLLFIAEAYWDMEWTLQQQGFDLCYDKRLYDRLAHEPAESVRGHLQADAAYQERLLRFIENHDEPRAAATFGPGQARAAAVAVSTLPGARLYHDGQLEGRRTHIPVFLGRGPDEPADGDLRAFYERLLRAVADGDLRDGEWRLCEVEGWPDNDSHRRLVAWCWTAPAARRLVVVNLSDAPAQGRVRLPWDDLAGRDWELADALDDRRFERSGDAMAGEGLYVGLDAWASHLLDVRAAPERRPAGPGLVATAPAAR
jgi:Alpha amylase, catalytic domain